MAATKEHRLGSLIFKLVQKEQEKGALIVEYDKERLNINRLASFFEKDTASGLIARHDFNSYYEQVEALFLNKILRPLMERLKTVEEEIKAIDAQIKEEFGLLILAEETND